MHSDDKSGFSLGGEQESLLFLKVFFFFLNCGPFLKSLLDLVQYCFFCMFWFFGHEACGILPP